MTLRLRPAPAPGELTLFLREAEGRLNAAFAAAYGADAPMRELTISEECPRCEEMGELDGSYESGVEFLEPLCGTCRSRILYEASSAYDEGYERAIANGWAD